MNTSHKAIIQNGMSFWSLLMIQIIAFIILCQLGIFIRETSAAQKFYPNGRYGRRSVNPPLMPSDGSDEGITFIGNVASNKLSKSNMFNTDQPTTLLCYYIGYPNLLKCSVRETSSDVLERANNENQQ